MGDRGCDEDLPARHAGKTLILGEQPVEQGGPGAKIANDEYRLFDILLFVFGIEKVIQTICKTDTIMPERVSQEYKHKHEESFEGEPARRAFGFKEAVIESLEK